MTGTNQFVGNLGDGLRVLSLGNVYVNNVTSDGNGEIGVDVISSSTTISCSNIFNNSQVGVVASNYLTLSGVNFSGNPKDYFVLGGIIIVESGDCSGGGNKKITNSPSLPVSVINTVNGEIHVLDCVSFRGTELTLPDGDGVYFPCPIGDEASLTSLTSDKLPGRLDGDFSFISGLEVEVKPSTEGTTIVQFTIPEEQKGKTLSILFWNGMEWKELGGAVNGDGKFEVSAVGGGTFVLVTK